MKKFFLLGLVFFICGCGADRIVDDVSDDVNSTSYGLAKNSMWGYVKSIELAYTEYQYAKLTGDYGVFENSTLVNVDGVDIQLNVESYGDQVKCSSVRIVDGHARLDGCIVNGYRFSFNGNVIDD